MRKSLLGILLAATLLPMSAVHAANEAKDSYNSSAKSTTAQKKAAVEKAIADGVQAGLTVEQAMAELFSAGADDTQVITAAIAAAPGRAGEIAAFATSKGVQPNVATQAAVAAAPLLAADIITSVSNQIDQMPVSAQQKVNLNNSLIAGAQAANVPTQVINQAFANTNTNSNPNIGGVGSPQQQPQQQQQVVNNPTVGGGGTSCAAPKVIRNGSCS